MRFLLEETDERGSLRGARVAVADAEPPDPDHRFATMAHIGGALGDMLGCSELHPVTGDGCDFLIGREPRNVVHDEKAAAFGFGGDTDVAQHRVRTLKAKGVRELANESLNRHSI